VFLTQIKGRGFLACEVVENVPAFEPRLVTITNVLEHQSILPVKTPFSNLSPTRLSHKHLLLSAVQSRVALRVAGFPSRTGSFHQVLATPTE